MVSGTALTVAWSKATYNCTQAKSNHKTVDRVIWKLKKHCDIKYLFKIKGLKLMGIWKDSSDLVMAKIKK